MNVDARSGGQDTYLCVGRCATKHSFEQYSAALHALHALNDFPRGGRFAQLQHAPNLSRRGLLRELLNCSTVASAGGAVATSLAGAFQRTSCMSAIARTGLRVCCGGARERQEASMGRVASESRRGRVASRLFHDINLVSKHTNRLQPVHTCARVPPTPG